LWVGDAVAADAPFSITKAGAMKAIAGTVGGWDISSSNLSKNFLTLDPGGRIEAGETDTDKVIMDTQNVDGWRFWIGNVDPALASFRVKGDGEAWLTNVHIQGLTESANYISGQSGWHLGEDGFAEFMDVVIRGKITSAIFEQESVSVIAGRQLITEAALLIADLADTDTTIDLDSNVFFDNDIIKFQSTGSRRCSWTEWQ